MKTVKRSKNLSSLATFSIRGCAQDEWLALPSGQQPQVSIHLHITTEGGTKVARGADEARKAGDEGAQSVRMPDRWTCEHARPFDNPAHAHSLARPPSLWARPPTRALANTIKPPMSAHLPSSHPPVPSSYVPPPACPLSKGHMPTPDWCAHPTGEHTCTPGGSSLLSKHCGTVTCT